VARDRQTTAADFAETSFFVGSGRLDALPVRPAIEAFQAAAPLARPIVLSADGLV
jgi:hypothetical protein